MRKNIDMTVTVCLDFDEDVVPFESAVVEFVNRIAVIASCGDTTLTQAMITDISNITEVVMH